MQLSIISQKTEKNGAPGTVLFSAEADSIRKITALLFNIWSNREQVHLIKTVENDFLGPITPLQKQTGAKIGSLIFMGALLLDLSFLALNCSVS